MAWNATLPAGSTSISGSDDLIRDNWAAIETGTVPYDALKLQTQGSDPTAVADYGFLFSKDVSSKAELHYIDEDSNVIQITSAGSLGSATENFAAAKIDVDNLRLDGNTIISTDTNGDINITPDGTGSVVISKADINSGAIDGTAIGAASASTGVFTTITAASLAYPTSDGSANQFISTDGAGTLSFATAGTLVQQVVVTDNSHFSTASSIPADDTIPQNTEGAELFTLAITPTNASNYLLIQVDMNIWSTLGNSLATAALFQDSTAGALAASGVWNQNQAGFYPEALTLVHRMTAGTTSATTFKIRVGSSLGTTYVNGSSTGRFLGGVMKATMIISEIKA